VNFLWSQGLIPLASAFLLKRCFLISQLKFVKKEKVNGVCNYACDIVIYFGIDHEKIPSRE